MIDKFGRIMVYVNDPRAVADFFVNKIGFTELKVNTTETGIMSVEVAPCDNSDALIEFFGKSINEIIAPDLNMDMPSICFSSYDIRGLRDKLISNGVNASEVEEIAGSITINFSDVEGNYYSVREVSRT